MEHADASGGGVSEEGGAGGAVAAARDALRCQPRLSRNSASVTSAAVPPAVAAARA